MDLYFTEGGHSTFASPYVASFVFLAVCALLRWGRRKSVIAIAVLVALHLLDCLVLVALGIDLELQRVIRRQVYMAMIALAFVWITPGAAAPPLARFSPSADVRSPEALLRLGLDHAMAETGARAGALVWGETGGLPRQLVVRRDGVTSGRCLDPDEGESLDAPVAGREPVLWSPRTGHRLRMSGAGTPVIDRAAYPELLAGCTRGRDAIMAPILTSHVEATLMLWDIAGLCGDHLRLVGHLQADIETALDRGHLAVLQEQAMVAQMRGALARDLHDGVAQSLAGAMLRLEGLRSALRSGRDPLENLDDAKSALRAEQLNVREMITRLKDEANPPVSAEAAGELGRWIDSAAAVWGVDATFTAGGAPVRLKQTLAFELRQLLREAIANAARHGECRQVRISLDRAGHDGLCVTIEDDGSGLAEGADPRSISERVLALGGELETGSATIGGARLVVTLPHAVAP